MIGILFLVASTLADDAEPPICDADVFQQEAAPEHPTFAAVESHLGRTPVFRAEFQQEKNIRALRRPLRSTGRFLFAVDKGIYWHTTHPVDSVFIVGPRGILQKSAHGEPLRIEARERPILDGFTRIFLSLFGGDTRELARQFKLFVGGDATGWTLGLEPKNPVMKKLFSHIIMCGGKTIASIEWVETSGDRTHIRFEPANAAATGLSAEESAYFDF